MKIKKLLSVICASVIAAASVSLTASAVEDGKATYCFDSPAAVSEWSTYGSVKETGFNMHITNDASKNGNGSLVLSLASDGKANSPIGGAFVEASKFGLNSFDGCTIEMSVMLCEGADGMYDNLVIYADGKMWLQNEVPDLSTKEWSTVVMTVPENSKDTKVGFTIPTFEAYTGDVVYIDDFVITKPDGKIVKNRGDYELKKIVITALPKGSFIIGIALLVIFAAVIAGGVYLLVKSTRSKFL